MVVQEAGLVLVAEALVEHAVSLAWRVKSSGGVFPISAMKFDDEGVKKVELAASRNPLAAWRTSGLRKPGRSQGPARRHGE